MVHNVESIAALRSSTPMAPATPDSSQPATALPVDVLLIEDNAADVRFFGLLLESAPSASSFRLRHAATLADGLERLRERAADVIVSAHAADHLSSWLGYRCWCCPRGAANRGCSRRSTDPRLPAGRATRLRLQSSDMAANCGGCGRSSRSHLGRTRSYSWPPRRNRRGPL